MKARYYNPHPGWGGAAVPCPEPIRQVAEELDGTTGDLDEALARFRAACPGTEVKAHDTTPCCILVTVKVPGVATHCFRAIQFDPLGD